MSDILVADIFVPVAPGSSDTVAAKVWGNIQEFDQAFVACHGWLDNAATYNFIAPLIIRNHPGKAIFVAIDFSGHGLSSHSQERYFGPTGYLSDVKVIVDHFALETFVAVGHSMGGVILTNFCTIFPERVTHFISIEIVGQADAPPSRFPVQLRAHYDTRDRRLASGSSKPRYPSLEAAAIARSQAKLSVPLEGARELAERGVEPVFTRTESGARVIEYTWRTDMALTLPWLGETTKEVAMTMLRGIQCPVLFVFGKDGYIDLTAPKIQDRLAAVNTKEVLEVKGGHHPHLDRDSAPVIVDNILRFVREYSAPTRAISFDTRRVTMPTSKL
ncbi:hypothetical protein GGF31_002849 [Allomyces arbusculus]|nr:hypothetical protein GGF31_002849 [Allomyces arbusculus]